MIVPDEGLLPGLERSRRQLGRAGGTAAGPTLIFVAGLHGNEPSGVLALERVLGVLARDGLPVRGEVVGLAGNLRALAAGRRYLARDLNRMWTPDQVERARRAGGNGEFPEDREQRELLGHLHGAMDRARGEILVLDLHSASAPTPPFLILGDTLRNREFARRFPAPVVLGLEEQLDGTLMEYVTGLGHVSLAFEGGQHADPASAGHHEAAIWLALVHMGALAASSVPAFETHRARLRRAGRGVPRILEILHRHDVGPEDDFVMQPGYRNFQPVRRGQRLAADREGAIHAPGDFLLFLPLYQGLGSDGFFLARPVNRFWLALSSLLRRLGVPTLASRFPGVRVHPRRRNTLLVEGRIARLLVPQVFHLLGYRVRRAGGRDWVVSRRPE